ncbi:retinoic acid receptor responder protein 3-like [Vombatus ursinus]|uniref:LRAT domain-containing protein n=1 Tax=Vombatus ursinus TaxID=29139 RepID=A0A4X2KD13_VOMUR|nr:retinoic acid receptor responder protein 3-like [Vombatus ursinus]
MPAPKPGDLIEFFQPKFHHWGIYVGKNLIIHLVPIGKTTTSMMATHGIVEKKPFNIDQGENYRVNNIYDELYQPLPPEVIIAEALEMVGNMVPYCAITQNCHDFVIDLRYGKQRKMQLCQSCQDLGEMIIGILRFVFCVAFTPRA